MENDWVRLAQFIEEGMSVSRSQSTLSPLRLAAEEGRLECCVYLLQAQAMVRPSSLPPGPARILIQALTGQLASCNLNEFDEVMDCLASEARIVADRLFEAVGAQEAPGPNQHKELASQQRAIESRGDTVIVGELLDGTEYEVVSEAVRIRREPSVKAAFIGVRTRGQVVMMYEFDESRLWRRVETGGKTGMAKDLQEPDGSGWMLLGDPQLGELMKPLSIYG
jgi:hypothetical protein